MTYNVFGGTLNPAQSNPNVNALMQFTGGEAQSIMHWTELKYLTPTTKSVTGLPFLIHWHTREGISSLMPEGHWNYLIVSNTQHAVCKDKAY